MIIYKDKVFDFFEIFNEDNGTLFRSDINGVDPVMRSFPELSLIHIYFYASYIYLEVLIHRIKTIKHLPQYP